MANKQKAKAVRELRRRRHVRRRVSGTAERPRLSVYKSLRSTIAQLIDDDKGVTLAYSVSGPTAGKGTKTDAAKAVGKAIAAQAVEKGIKKIVFDRNHYLYHGRIKALAEGAREGGLEF
ncbi:MAG: 50S ribosomal protein L18 [Candidatus Zixiibacteriota bacterium]